MAKPTIFISYSHKDEEWKNRLVKQLGVLQQQDYLDIWVDTRIEGGADWFQEIKEAIEATSIAVLLISADFLNSKFITEQEVPLLLQQRQQKGLRIYPIILKPCDWLVVSWIAKAMVRPKDGRPLSAGTENQIETDLAAIATEIRELLQRAGLPREKRQFVPLPPDQVSLSKLPTTHHALFGRDKELKLSDDAWANPHCHVLCFVAFGGVGKTALVNEWLNQMEAENWRGAERVYGWSFYSQGTREDKQASADTFFDDALRFFGYTGEPLKSPWDKGKLLASLIKERKTLLILDGLEPLQYPPGVEEGRLRDQGLQALLKELARFNNGLCLITTRCKISDIEHTVGKTTNQIELENLSSEAGVRLLREAGVTKGTNKELQQAAVEYDGHALALTLLGRYLAVRYEGEISKRDTIKKLAYEKDRQGIHARHVMDSYEIWLKGTPELDLLYIMGLFDRPAPLGAIAALKQPPVINDLTNRLQRLSDEDWDFTIQHLREIRLLSAREKNRPDTLDCHPLIQEHFSQKLKAKSDQAWNRAHERLYEYYKNLPEKELPDTLEEMEPLFAAVAHGCQAGKQQEAYDEIYIERIMRENEAFIVRQLGAFGSFLAILSNFFDQPWKEINKSLKESDQGVVLSNAGFGLRALGRLREATQPTQTALENRIKQRNLKGCALDASDLSEIYLISGNVPQAVSYARQSVEFADRSEDNVFQILIGYGSQTYGNRTKYANALLHFGDHNKSEELFEEAESLFKKRQSEYHFLYSIAGFWYCDLLLSQGKVREVLERTNKALEWEKQIHGAPILDFALHKLSLGRAYLLEAVGKMDSTSEVESMFKTAADYLNQAVAGLREAGQYLELPRGLFARAFFYRVQNQFHHAWDDLDEAREIAEQGEMKLWLVDYHLEASRLLISEFGFRNGDYQHAPPTVGTHTTEETFHDVGTFHDVETFHEMSLRPNDEMSVRRHHETSLQNADDHLKQAAELVQKTGYHRRDPEVELGYAGLFLAQGDQGRHGSIWGVGKICWTRWGFGVGIFGWSS